jgi:hypothetical protein
MSEARMLTTGFPLLIDSSSTSSSRCFSISSARRHISLARSLPGMRPHLASSKAARAAATAASISAAPPSATWAITRPEPGSNVSNILLAWASTHRPPISNWCLAARKPAAACPSFGWMKGAFMVSSRFVGAT